MVRETNDTDALCPNCGCTSWNIRTELSFMAECEECGHLVDPDNLEALVETPQFPNGEKATAEWTDA